MKARQFTVLISAIGLSAVLLGCQSSSKTCRAGDDQGAGSDQSVTQPQYWNYFWMRGRPSIDVALFNYGYQLKIQGGNELRGFEVAGKDSRFHPAQAHIQSQITGDGELKVTWISLSSDEVEQPFYIRYATGEYATTANLVNTLGEPAIAFTTQK